MKKLKKTANGFFMIELLIYIILSSIFLLLLYQFTAYSYINSKKLNQSISKNCLIYNALDKIAYDLQNYKNISFNLKDNKIYRIQDKIESLLCDNIKEFIIDNKNKLITIKIITLNNKTIFRSVYSRSGFIE